VQSRLSQWLCEIQLLQDITVVAFPILWTTESTIGDEDGEDGEDSENELSKLRPIDDKGDKYTAAQKFRVSVCGTGTRGEDGWQHQKTCVPTTHNAANQRHAHPSV